MPIHQAKNATLNQMATEPNPTPPHSLTKRLIHFGTLVLWISIATVFTFVFDTSQQKPNIQ